MNNKIEDEAAVAAAPAKAAKARPAKKPARAKAKTKPGESHGYDFVGKVESIVVKGGGEAGAFEFGLRGRHGARQTFRLSASDSFALAVMAPIVTAAHATEVKIGVRVAPAGWRAHMWSRSQAAPSFGSQLDPAVEIQSFGYQLHRFVAITLLRAACIPCSARRSSPARSFTLPSCEASPHCLGRGVRTMPPMPP